MEYTIDRIIDVYRQRKLKLETAHLRSKKWYAFLCSKMRQQSKLTWIGKQLAFQSSFSEYIVTELKKHPNYKTEWMNALLLYKNKTEIFGYQIDFLNYLHTFLAFTIVMLLLFNEKFQENANWSLVFLTTCLIVWVFVARSNHRLELSAYKEVINIFESNKEKFQEE